MQLILSLFLAINTHFIQINIQLGLFFYILSAGVQIKVDVLDGWLRLNTSVRPTPMVLWAIMVRYRITEGLYYKLII